MSKEYSNDAKHSKEEEEMEEKKNEKKNVKPWNMLFAKQEGEMDTKKKTLIQKIGMNNLCILLICGIALFYLCFMKEPASKTEDKKTSKTTSIQSESQNETSTYVNTNTETEDYVEKLEKKLKEKLSLVKDIGNVEVMITLAESKEVVALKDAPYTHDSMNESDGEGGSRVSETTTRGDETVMATAEDGGAQPYVVKEIQPTISGVLVIAQGGGNAAIQWDIVEAVEALFDIPVHKIKVMEMGQEKE